MASSRPWSASLQRHSSSSSARQQQRPRLRLSTTLLLLSAYRDKARPIYTGLLEQLRQFKRQLLSPVNVADTFNLQTGVGKALLARALWSGDYGLSLQGSIRQ